MTFTKKKKPAKIGTDGQLTTKTSIVNQLFSLVCKSHLLMLFTDSLYLLKYSSKMQNRGKSSFKGITPIFFAAKVLLQTLLMTKNSVFPKKKKNNK